jgi:hypothetical protein
MFGGGGFREVLVDRLGWKHAKKTPRLIFLYQFKRVHELERY